jgi:glycyl-tRNA synthetase beta chain
MDRELLIEIGTEELPARWLPGLTHQLAEHVAARLAGARLTIDAPVETFGTPRRLTARVSKVGERQSDLEEVVTGPAVAAAFGADRQPTPAASGFARRHGVDVPVLEQVETPKGKYLAYRKWQRGKAAVDVLPDVLSGVLRDLSFPKQMRWDARLDDGGGDLLFGRPIRWLLFLYGGRVVPFTIARTELARSPQVQEVTSGAVTFGHRFLATSGRPGRAIRVRSFENYRARLLENFVVLDRSDRHDRIARELDLHAERLGGRVSRMAGQLGLLQELPDLVEYPSVVAGTFGAEFLTLPEEVLTTTMIRHQHYVPVVSAAGPLMPAFLAVTNTETDNARTIARNSERVLTARLRDARFFFDADRATSLEARVDDLEHVLFHRKLGSYRAKAERIERLAAWLAEEILGAPGAAGHASRAGLLAKADLTTEMVRELTELQGTMGGVYAREEGQPEEVWRAIYHHYLPIAVEADAPPARDELGKAAVTWAAVALADKLDTTVGLFAAGERPTGTRDPFGLRRQGHGILKILVDLPALTGLDVAIRLPEVIRRARLNLQSAVEAGGGSVAERGEESPELSSFLLDRLRYLFQQRGFSYDEVNAVAGSATGLATCPLDARRRLEALRAVRGSENFEALAVAFKRVKNLAKELKREPAETFDLLREPAEQALVAEYRGRDEAIRAAIRKADYQSAFTLASGLRPAVDRFFADIFVMVDDPSLRDQRLTLVWRLHELLLGLADISEIAPRTDQKS